MKSKNSSTEINAFVSCIIVVDEQTILKDSYVERTCSILENTFLDYELILIRSRGDKRNDFKFPDLSKETLSHTIIINLSRSLDRMNALASGLDIANGDYIINLDPSYEENPDCIKSMYDLSQESNDVVQLISNTPHPNLSFRILEKIFNIIYNKFSSTRIPQNLHESFLISRRALNSMLEMRESIRFLDGLISYIGYNREYIHKSIEPNPNEKLRDRLHSYKIGLVSFTDMLSKIIYFLFFGSFVGGSLIAINALTVKYTSHDLLGNQVESLPTGWTFIIIFLSFIFCILFLSMYIMSLYVSSMHSETKKRPLYIIESIDRYSE